MTGIYGGVSITLGCLLAQRRLGATRLGSRGVIVLLALMFLTMVADGVNSTVTDLGLAHPYTSTNETRIITGLLSGVSIAAVLAWVVAAVARPQCRRRRSSRCLVSCSLPSRSARASGCSS